jgi:hypothetical protein
MPAFYGREIRAAVVDFRRLQVRESFFLSPSETRNSLRIMNPRITTRITALALLLPAIALAGDPAPATQPESKPVADVADATNAKPQAKLDLEVRRQIALDDQVMRNLERASTREPELTPRKLFPDAAADLPMGSRVALTLRPSVTTYPHADRGTTRCDLSVCRVYDDRGRVMYSYQAARLGIDVPATRERWESCQARQNDMMSTFDRADRCNGIHSRVPSPWDPAPRAWP